MRMSARPCRLARSNATGELTPSRSAGKTFLLVIFADRGRRAANRCAPYLYLVMTYYQYRPLFPHCSVPAALLKLPG